MAFKIKKITVGSNIIYKMYDKFYIVIKADACRTCCFHNSDACLEFTEPSCMDVIGSNRYSRQCFMELNKNGGV